MKLTAMTMRYSQDRDMVMMIDKQRKPPIAVDMTPEAVESVIRWASFNTPLFRRLNPLEKILRKLGIHKSVTKFSRTTEKKVRVTVEYLT